MDKNSAVVETADYAREPEQLPLYRDAAGDIDLVTLRQRRELMRGPRLSERTMRCYASDWRVFVAWCMAAGRRPLPASAETLTLYVTWLLTERRRRTTTAGRHVTAVMHHHRRSGLEPPAMKDAQEVIAHEKRRRREQPRGKAALTPDSLRLILATCDLATPCGVRDRALILLGFGSGLRRSEIVSLRLSDVSFRPEGIAVTIRHAKNDQEGKGRIVGVWAGRHDLTDPVRAVRRWIEVRGEWEGPLFTRMKSARGGKFVVGRDSIDGQSVAKAIKRAAARAGLNSSDFSGHSLRAGAVTAAADAGSTDAEIMKMSGHKALTTMRGYIRSVAAFHGRNPLAGVL